MVLNTRTALNDATARRLARSYQRAKPARLVETATGRFLTRPFVRDDTWLVAVAYQPRVVTHEWAGQEPARRCLDQARRLGSLIRASQPSRGRVVQGSAGIEDHPSRAVRGRVADNRSRPPRRWPAITPWYWWPEPPAPARPPPWRPPARRSSTTGTRSSPSPPPLKAARGARAETGARTGSAAWLVFQHG